MWFRLGQISGPYGDKYSGGLGTYTMKHLPMAVHAAEADATFFVYGGRTAGRHDHLLAMASRYDHHRHEVPRPTVVRDLQGVDDPHDNPTLNVAADGHVWVFVSGRARRRPGFKYRSIEPLSVDRFALVAEQDMTYPQPFVLSDGRFVHLFTKYTAGRELYWETSADGWRWQPARKLAGFGGHYQISGQRGDTLVSAFNYHPGGDVDRRTNLYVVASRDGGRTWTTVDGQPLTTPLAQPDNPALVIDHEARDLLNFNKDVGFDRHGNPMVLHLVAGGAQPGPAGAPRTWQVTRWDGHEWRTRTVTASDHNYDSGSLYPDGEVWRVMAPTEPGPQPHHTGGEVAVWESADEGRSWRLARRVTRGSAYNHGYVRRPLRARAPFCGFWADGDAAAPSASRLYFGDLDGRYWRLPYDMAADTASPEELTGDGGG